MELVNYSDDDEEDETRVDSDIGTERIEISAVLKSRWAATESSDEDEEQKEDNKTSTDGKPKSVSVLELLSSSQKPSFLSKQSDQQFHLKPVVHNDYNAKPKVPIIEQPTPQELAKANVMSRAEFEEIAKSKAVSDMMRQPTEEDIPLNAKIMSVKRTDKESAKDRVKRQRLSGQSGIGSDFKVWKSDEEMRQRQQYD